MASYKSYSVVKYFIVWIGLVQTCTSNGNVNFLENYLAMLSVSKTISSTISASY